ncbi:MAG: hypothetical protein QM739_04830 [Propionivibrio sp.]
MADQTNIRPLADPSICFVIPYFGKWPLWFPFFLKSCEFNPTVTWHLHTDCGTPDSLPANVRVFDCTFTEYCQRVSVTLHITFTPESPYKLCDLKPTLGVVHEEELRPFDFWAFGDIDVIYGDIRRYFTAERLARHDIFSTHRRRISGHFCLLRNNRQMREAFMSVHGWQELLSTRTHVAFDESAFSRLFVRHKNWPDWLADLAKPLHKWARRTENVEAYSTPNASVRWLDGSLDFPETWFWDHGHLTNNRDKEHEFPYLHFMTWKQRDWPERTFGWSPELTTVLATLRWQVSAQGFQSQ